MLNQEEWEEVVVIGSGPSLTISDVEIARRWADRRTRRHIVVACRAFEWVLDADAVVALDEHWWSRYHFEVYGRSPNAFRYSRKTYTDWQVDGLEDVAPSMPIHSNSGTQAVEVAIAHGAHRIYLLGMDCQPGENGRLHFHEEYAEHPSGLGFRAAPNMHVWSSSWSALWWANFNRRRPVTILNCTRSTSLALWPRANVEMLLPLG